MKERSSLSVMTSQSLNGISLSPKSHHQKWRQKSEKNILNFSKIFCEEWSDAARIFWIIRNLIKHTRTHKCKLRTQCENNYEISSISHENYKECCIKCTKNYRQKCTNFHY